MSYLQTADTTLDGTTAPKRLGMPGFKFCLMEAAGRVDVDFIAANGQKIGELRGVQSGIEVMLTREFTFLDITSTTPQSIKVATSSGEVNFNRVSGSISAAIDQGDTITNSAAVTVGNTVAVLIKTANAAHVGVAFRSADTNTDRIAIGGAGVTFANAVHILDPGKVYTDDNASPAAFYAISESAASQSVRVEVRA